MDGEYFQCLGYMEFYGFDTDIQLFGDFCVFLMLYAAQVEDVAGLLG